MFPRRMAYTLMAAVSLAVSACADQGYQVFSVSYEFTDRDRTAGAQRALQSAQDQCYLGGSQYAMAVGPPQIVSDPTSGHFRATQSFRCIGMRGEG
jgi:hypothetical protein